MKAAAAALLSFALAGCAPAAQTVHARAPAPPVSQWETGESATDDDLETTAPEDTATEHPVESTPPVAPEPPGPSTQTAQAGDGALTPLVLAGLEPTVVHRARIEMARAALVEENQNKERVDLAEELQRELAALQASSQASKSRGRHGGPKKQP